MKFAISFWRLFWTTGGNQKTSPPFSQVFLNPPLDQNLNKILSTVNVYTFLALCNLTFSNIKWDSRNIFMCSYNVQSCLLLFLFEGTRHNPGCLNHCLWESTAEKIRCQEEVNRTNKAIELANRLVKGLRWGPTGQANEAAYRKHFFVIHYWSGNNRGT